MQKYQVYPAMINFENMIAVNKILKVNILVYDKELKSFYGYCQDNTDFNVLKLFTPATQYDFNAKYIDSIQYEFPNFVAFSKDISAVYKIANINSVKIGLDMLDYRGENGSFAYRFGVKAFRSTIIEEERQCFDYKPFKEKMINVVSEMALLPNTEVYTDILNINVFKEAIDAPSAKGILPVRYNHFVYFITPNFINYKKGEKIDLLVKTNETTNTKLLDFKVYKKEGILDIIYRQFAIKDINI